MPSEEPNYLAHAFKSQYNLIGLGTALGFAILSGTLLPIIVAAGVEMVVLPLVSGSGRFQRLVRARTSEEADEQDAARQRMESSEMLQYMPEAERARYRTLQALTNEIRQNYKGMDSSSQMLLEQLVEKLDFLLSFYLRMRYSLTRYHNYFNSTDPERIQERIAMLEHEMKSGPSACSRSRPARAPSSRSASTATRRRSRTATSSTPRRRRCRKSCSSCATRATPCATRAASPSRSTAWSAPAEETERGVKDMERSWPSRTT
jgi:hypothetical protein